MLRILTAAVVMVTAVHSIHDAPNAGVVVSPAVVDAATDIRTLLAEAAGTPPVICAVAARAIWNGGWFWGRRTPVHPLPAANERNTWESRDGLAESDVAFALEQLTAANGCVREIAVQLLARDGGDASASGLEAYLRNRDPELVAVAALGLGVIAEERSLEPLIAAAGNPSVTARVNTIWALGRIGDTRGYRTVIRGLEDTEMEVRLAATEALGRIDTSAAVAALQRSLWQDSSPEVRRIAAWALAQHDADGALNDLGRALSEDNDAGVREMSAWAIGSIDRAGADAALVEAARRDSDTGVRESAVWALGVRDDRANATAVGELLAAEKDARVRATAAWALGVMRPASAPRALVAALGDANADIRGKAAWALSEIRDSSTVSAVSSALRKETDERTRRALLRALIRSGAAESQLVALLDSPNAKDRQMVARALAGSDRIDPWPWPMPRPRPFP